MGCQPVVEWLIPEKKNRPSPAVDRDRRGEEKKLPIKYDVYMTVWWLRRVPSNKNRFDNTIGNSSIRNNDD